MTSPLSSAHFKMNGSLSATGGYDTTHSATVNLQLEDSPALDINVVTYSQISKTKGAPDLVGLPATVLLPPSTIVPVTAPASGIHTYGIQAQVNGGVDANGNPVPGYTFVRDLAIRGVITGGRKIVASERGEYDPINGWTGAQNDQIDAAEAAAVAGGLPPSIIVWKPGVATSAPVYETWAEILTELAAAKMAADLVFDFSVSSANIPNTTLIDGLGRLQLRGVGETVTQVTFDDGAQIKNVSSYVGLQLEAAPTIRSPLLYDMTPATLTVTLTDCFLGTFGGTKNLMDVDGAGIILWLRENSFFGSGAIHVSNIADLELHATDGEQTSAASWGSKISGDVGTTLDLHLDSSYDPAITAGGGGTLALFLGSFSVIQTDFAPGIAYTPAVPGQWASTAPKTDQQAIDRLAAAVFALRSSSPIP